MASQTLGTTSAVIEIIIESLITTTTRTSATVIGLDPLDIGTIEEDVTVTVIAKSPPRTTWPLKMDREDISLPPNLLLRPRSLVGMARLSKGLITWQSLRQGELDTLGRLPAVHVFHD